MGGVQHVQSGELFESQHEHCELPVRKNHIGELRAVYATGAEVSVLTEIIAGARVNRGCDDRGQYHAGANETWPEGGRWRSGHGTADRAANRRLPLCLVRSLDS